MLANLFAEPLPILAAGAIFLTGIALLLVVGGTIICVAFVARKILKPEKQISNDKSDKDREPL